MSHTDVLPQPDLRPDAFTGYERAAGAAEALVFDEAAFAEAVTRLDELDDTNRPLVEVLGRRAETKRYSANDSANQRLINL